MIDSWGLSSRQERFCQYYSWVVGSCYGNATQAYLTVYACSKNSAEASGARMLGNVKVCEYIRKLHGERLSPEAVDAECAKVLFQDHDLSNKMRAIDRMDRIHWRTNQEREQRTIHNEFYMGIIRTVERNRLREAQLEERV